MEEEKINLAKSLGYSSIPEFIQRLDKHQLAYILQDIGTSTFLDACPGSGKTEVIGIKCAFEFSKWSLRNSGIAVLSFTNSASTELEQRIRKYNPGPPAFYPHYVGTFDSWLHKYLLHPHGWAVFNEEPKRSDKKFVIISGGERVDYLKGFNYLLPLKSGKKMPIGINQFDYSDLNSSQIKIGNSTFTLDATQVKTLKEKKKSAFKTGFATYGDVDILIRGLLDKRKELAKIIAKRFPVVLIDECQDLSGGQNALLQILKDVGISTHYVGDLNQSIYSFRKAEPDKTKKFITRNNLTVLKLIQNFRSGQSIVNVCCAQQKISIPIVGLSDGLETPCWFWEYNQDNLHELPSYFEQSIKGLGFSNEDSAIVARGHSIIRRLKGPTSGDKKNLEHLANSLFQWNAKPKTGTKLDDAMQSMGKLLSNAVFSGKGGATEYYRPDSVNPVEWRAHLAKMISIFSSEGLYPFINQTSELTWKVFAEKAREIFKRRAQDMGFDISESQKQFSKLIRVPSGNGNTTVNSYFYVTANTKSVSVTPRSIHSVKGMTFDSVLCVSSLDKKSDGGHVEQWLSTDPKDSESTRFAYVAWSRSQHLLILAIPEETDQQVKEKLVEIGFTKKTWGQTSLF